MRLTNDQIIALATMGFGRLNYASLATEDALDAYRLRKAVVKISEDITATVQDIKEGVWADKDLFARCVEYEKSKTGMEEAEYKAAIATANAKVAEMLAAYGKESRDIDVHPIAFASWLQLLKDNPYLAGFEETLAEFIAE